MRRVLFEKTKKDVTQKQVILALKNAILHCKEHEMISCWKGSSTAFGSSFGYDLDVKNLGSVFTISKNKNNSYSISFSPRRGEGVLRIFDLDKEYFENIEKIITNKRYKLQEQPHKIIPANMIEQLELILNL